MEFSYDLIWYEIHLISLEKYLKFCTSYTTYHEHWHFLIIIIIIEKLYLKKTMTNILWNSAGNNCWQNHKRFIVKIVN